MVLNINMNDIKYPNKFYNIILDKIIEKVPTADNQRIIAWKRQIKQLFVDGFLIKEILLAMPEAFKRSKWQMPFFKRIKQIILERRYNTERQLKFKKNKMESMRDLLSRY